MIQIQKHKQRPNWSIYQHSSRRLLFSASIAKKNSPFVQFEQLFYKQASQAPWVLYIISKSNLNYLFTSKFVSAWLVLYGFVHLGWNLHVIRWASSCFPCMDGQSVERWWESWLVGNRRVVMVTWFNETFNWIWDVHERLLFLLWQWAYNLKRAL